MDLQFCNSKRVSFGSLEGKEVVSQNQTATLCLPLILSPCKAAKRMATEANPLALVIAEPVFFGVAVLCTCACQSMDN